MNVGLLGFTDRIELDIPLKRGSTQIWQILESLWKVNPTSVRTDFSLPFSHLFRRLKTSTLIFLISDFIRAEEALSDHALRHIARRHDVVPLIIADDWEEELPGGRGFARLRDAESGAAMVVNLSGKNKGLYKSMMRERRASLERGLYGLGLDHLFLHAGKPYLDPLIGFFLARKRAR
jgi:uncharacterized protein (DUF58 family)